jgi:hypothetical protein
MEGGEGQERATLIYNITEDFNQNKIYKLNKHEKI